MTGPGINLLNLTCTIKTTTFAASTTTGFAPATVPAGTSGTPCAVQAMTSREAQHWGRETGVTMLWLYLPPGTTIKTQSRVLIAGCQYDTKTLSVVGPPQDEAGRGSHLRVPCQLMEGGGLK